MAPVLVCFSPGFLSGGGFSAEYFEFCGFFVIHDGQFYSSVANFYEFLPAKQTNHSFFEK
jgi:hypothetical protein